MKPSSQRFRDAMEDWEADWYAEQAEKVRALGWVTAFRGIQVEGGLGNHRSITFGRTVQLLNACVEHCCLSDPLPAYESCPRFPRSHPQPLLTAGTRFNCACISVCRLNRTLKHRNRIQPVLPQLLQADRSAGQGRAPCLLVAVLPVSMHWRLR